MDFWSLFATLYLPFAVVLGLIIIARLAYTATGIVALNHLIATAVRSEIVRLNDGNPVSTRQAIRDFAHSTALTAFQPLRSLRTTDVSWAREQQKVESLAHDFEYRREDYEWFEATRNPSSSFSGSPFDAENAAAVASRSYIAALETSTSIAELRTTLKPLVRTRCALVYQSLRSESIRSYLFGNLVRLADYIGRGTALGLVVGIVASQPISEMLDRVASFSLTGGVVGAIAFSATLVSKLGGRSTSELRKFIVRVPLIAVPTLLAVIVALSTAIALIAALAAAST